ncbi:DNA-binding protein BIN4 [Aristolochia californica]|uniref:DNA-binding protein BIN4 n=1 Tax=Aristolochia californica TaxID=171875 RepID=UPI0035DCD773
MSSSREGSPDWLRSFEAPKQSCVTFSLSSDSSPSYSPVREKETDASFVSRHKEQEEQQNHDLVLVDSGDEFAETKDPKSKTLKIRKQEENLIVPEGDGYDCAEEEILEKATESRVASCLPLVFAEKVARSKALVECEGQSIDMSGDVGAVGRVVISSSQSVDPEMFLDLKGTIYKTTIVPSRTFCVVSFGQSEAKIEAVMNDFIQLKSISNLYECETMIEGTLDGFSFDSEEEGEKIPKPSSHCKDEKNESKDPGVQTSKQKNENTTGTTRKKAKVAGKQPAKGGRKSQGAKAKKSKK